ncbi:MAG: AraC family transcriptional regulator [Lachnospiraceae bacterium]|jgi:AraC-like DNA-binding protein/quercetin dioxygenase-like cupin family protein|nr:AraC family transcriptional regulator [Lachnospiraceae bacterium]
MTRQEQNTRQIYEVIQVPETTGVRFFTETDAGSYVPSHWHDAIEIIYMVKGELDVTVESSHSHLNEGQCILINSGVIHSTKCSSPNVGIVLQIPFSFIQLYLPDIGQLQFVLDESSDSPIRRTKLDVLKETLRQMQIANDIRPKGYILRFNSLLFELLFQLYHNFSVKVFHARLNHKAKDLNRLNLVLQYTNTHYNQPIALEEIAQVAFLESGYFCRFFKKHMGLTFLEYQNEVRLSHIYQDLLSTNDTLQQILERHGFTNYKLFRRVFAEHFHATPLQVRRNWREEG